MKDQRDPTYKPLDLDTRPSEISDVTRTRQSLASAFIYAAADQKFGCDLMAALEKFIDAKIKDAWIRSGP